VVGRNWDRGLLFSIGLVAAVLIISAGLTYRNTNQLNEDAGSVAHSHLVLDLCSDLMLAVVDTETAERGFIITGEEAFLEPYHAALNRIDGLMASLKEETKDNATQRLRLTELESKVSIRLNWLKEGINRRRLNEKDAQAIVRSRQGKSQMDEIRSLVAEMEGEEQELLVQRNRKSTSAYYFAVTSGFLTALAGLAMIGAFVWLLQRSLTARDKAARLLQEQRQWLQTTLASIGDAVIATDKRGRVTFLNSVAQSLTGWNEEEAKGQPLDTVFHIINENSRQPVENPAHRVFREGTVIGLANHTILLSRHGYEFPIDDSAAPIRNEAGKIFGVVLVFRDATGRRKADEALRLSESRFRTFAEYGPQMVWATDAQGKCQYVGPRWTVYTGLSLEQTADFENLHQVVHPDDYQILSDRWGKAFAAGGLFEVEYRLKRVSDGAYRWFLCRALPVRDSENRIVQWIGANADIDNQKRAELALKEADSRKDEFLATLAHELRNPLAPIRNALNILRHSDGDLNALHPIRDMMERQVQQLVRLVDDLMDVSRISSGKITLRSDQLELAAVIQSALETSRPLIDAAKQELIVTMPSEPLYVIGDQTRLAQVVSNLLNNSAKYTPDGGQILLTVVRNVEQAEIHVRDNGMGIPAEMLPKIFEMFTQVDRTLQRSQGGLGIGLTLVNRLVKMHSGTIEAQSKGSGQGSEFIVRLPLAPVLSEIPWTEEKPYGELRIDQKAKSRRILVVDDNIDSAESLGLLLRTMGHEVQTAHDGPSALKTAKSFRPEVVLMDIGLPGMSGHDVGRKLRDMSETKDSLLIAQTGWGQDEDRRRSTEAGFDFHFVKPVDPQALQELLAT
jgi:PAS domain S-box-containing protein